MPPEVVARAFEPFFTTKDVGKGVGLGLDIAQRIVAERHGGTITIDSRPGQTVLRVRLPAASADRVYGPDGLWNAPLWAGSGSVSVVRACAPSNFQGLSARFCSRP